MHVHCRSRYILHRQEGQCLYQRKSKHNIVRIFQFQCYIVKEYTGDPSKVMQLCTGCLGFSRSVLSMQRCCRASARPHAGSASSIHDSSLCHMIMHQ